jgi:predicted ArsR family transcriptional regulator
MITSFATAREKAHTGVVKTADLPMPAPLRAVPAASVRPAAATGGGDAAGERTRTAVVRLLASDGPLTVAELADRLGLTTAGVRRHLDQLTDDGAVTARPAISPAGRGRGRPARAFVLTDTGRSTLQHGYDQVALQAMRFLRELAGPDAVAAFARTRAQSLLTPYAAEIAAAPDVPTRARIVARALTEAGFGASLRDAGRGVQLCQHLCPVAAVAQEFPELCEAESAVLAEALGTHTQRLATIARGDSFCTTFIPQRDSAPAAPQSPQQPPEHAPPLSPSH